MIVLILKLVSSAKLGSITDFMYGISPVLFSSDWEEEVERFKKKKDKTLKIYYVYSWFCYFLPSSTLLLSRR